MEAGKTVLITGTSRGLGKELVKVFLEKEPGVKVWATSRQSEEEAKKMWAGHERHQQIRCVTLDVLSQDNISQLIGVVKAEGVKFDIVIHNAGIASMGG